MGGWEWMSECMFVFTMLFFCAGSGPWINMSEGHLPSFLAVSHHDIGQEGQKRTKA